MCNAAEHAVKEKSAKLLVLLPLRTIYNRTFQCETPCIYIWTNYGGDQNLTTSPLDVRCYWFDVHIMTEHCFHGSIVFIGSGATSAIWNGRASRSLLVPFCTTTPFWLVWGKIQKCSASIMHLNVS